MHSSRVVSKFVELGNACWHSKLYICLCRYCARRVRRTEMIIWEPLRPGLDKIYRVAVVHKSK